MKRQIGGTFAPPFDPRRTDGTLPLSPQQSLAALRTRPGLAVDLVAAEPLVASPVAIDFGPDGNETSMDLRRMMKIVDEAGYRGWVGIEYEGSRLTEFEGIAAAKRFLDTY